jgi:hypothetical protein
MNQKRLADKFRLRQATSTALNRSFLENLCDFEVIKRETLCPCCRQERFSDDQLAEAIASARTVKEFFRIVDAFAEFPDAIDVDEALECFAELEDSRSKAAKLQESEMVTITALNSQPLDLIDMRQLRDLVIASSDQYARMTIEQLRRSVSPGVRRVIEEALADEVSRAECYRWVLRGLNPDKAIAKIHAASAS